MVDKKRAPVYLRNAMKRLLKETDEEKLRLVVKILRAVAR